MPIFQIEISDDDAALLTALGAKETPALDVAGLIALKTTQLVNYRKVAAQKELLTTRLAKLAYADDKTLAALDAVELADGVSVAEAAGVATKILGR